MTNPGSAPRRSSEFSWASFVLRLGFALSWWPGLSPALALIAGLVCALTLGNPEPQRSTAVHKVLLQVAIVGLGFGLHLTNVMAAGATGVLVTIASVITTLLLGIVLGRILKLPRTLSLLLSIGTAICGGSAIAASAPVVRATSQEISVALGCVFVLNTIALFVFPTVGAWMGLDAQAFGWWAAMAIHDTSSVVGAAARHSESALAIAVPVKLARALWILPLVATLATIDRTPQKRSSVPWFIFGFVAAAALRTFVPVGAPCFDLLAQVGRCGLTASLFLIGAGLSRKSLQNLGLRPLAHATLLWLVVSLLSLAVVCRWFENTPL